MVAPSSITRDYIYGRSFTSWFFWWVLKLGKGILARKDVIAPRGPQILVFPPPNLGVCTADRWEHAGWTVVTLTPPPKPKSEAARSKRIMLYFYGSGFHRACHPRQWAFASYMAEKLDAETSVVPYPLVPLNNGKEVCGSHLAVVYVEGVLSYRNFTVGVLVIRSFLLSKRCIGHF